MGIQTFAIAASVCAVLGAGAYHALPVVGPGARIHALHEKIDKKNAALLAAADQLKLAATAIEERDTLLRDNGTTANSEATDLASLYRGICRDAFRAGQASNRCGAVPGAADAPGRVLGLRELQAGGAYQGSARGVSREPSGPR